MIRRAVALQGFRTGDRLAVALQGFRARYTIKRPGGKLISARMPEYLQVYPRFRINT